MGYLITAIGKQIFILFFLGGLASELMAQSPVYRYSQFTGEDGLPQMHFFDIEQDSTGYIWIATKGGVSRFDGDSFKNYSYDANDPTSLNSSYVIDILMVGAGDDFYALTDQGLNRYNAQKDRFEAFSFQPMQSPELAYSKHHLMADAEGDIWFSAFNGVFKFDTETHVLEKQQQVPFHTSLLKNYFFGISEDGTTLWYWQQGKPLYSKKLGETHWQPHELGQKDHYLIADIRQQKNTDPALIMMHDPMQNEVSILNYFPERNTTEMIFHEVSEQEKIGNHIPFSFYKGANKNVLYFFTKTGLFRLDLVTGQHEFLFDPNLNLIEAFTISKDGVMWLGASGSGLFSINLKRSQLFQEVVYGKNAPLGEASIRAIKQDGQGRIWVGGYNGMGFLDPSDQTVKGVLGLHEWEHFHIVTSIGFDPVKPERYLWFVSDQSALNRIDLNTMKPALPRGKSYLLDTFGNALNMILPDLLHQTLWLGTRQGLIKFDPISFKSEIFPIKIKGQATQVTFLAHDRFRKGIWMGTDSGIAFFNPETQRTEMAFTEQEGLSPSKVISIWVEKEAIWAGTQSSGLNRIEWPSQAITHYSTENGLPDNTIYSILPDEKKNLWLSTNQGLCRYTPLNDEVLIFDKKDGLQDNEFNTYAHFKDCSGKLYFGGIKGVNVIDPSNFQPINYAPPVIIQEVSIVGQDKIWKSPQGQTLVLEHDNAFLNVEFAALNYDIPEHNQFAYRLKGLHTEWIFIGNEPRITLTNLPVGDFTLQVKAANSANVWNERPAEVYLKVKPPFYQTTWALAMIAASILFLAYSFLKQRERRFAARKVYLKGVIDKRTAQLRDKNTEINTQKEALEEVLTDLEGLQSFRDFFTSTIVHDLKTPLNTVIDQSQDEEVKEAGTRMLRLVGNLLDVQKMEESKLQVVPETLLLSPIIKDCAHSVEYLLKKKTLTIGLQIEPQLTVKADKELLQRVLENILINAIKYSPSEGKITVKAACHSAEEVQIEVLDEGRGISPAKKELLFKKYPRMGEARTIGKAKATGLGLVFCKLAIEAMKGSIGYKRKEKLTDFWVRLPYVANSWKVSGSTEATEHWELAHTENAFEWSATETALLQPFVKELSELKVYQYTRILAVLEQIPEEHAQVKAWKESILQAQANYQENQFLALLQL